MRNIRFHTLLYITFFLSSIFNLSANEKRDSIQLSLLTCSPGEEIYSLFGHTAIRYENFTQNTDIVFNYGLFSFNTPNFIWRFSLGETDYQLGACNYLRFAAEYEYYNRGVYQQTLNLSPEEKEKLIDLLNKNYRPENRTYRYNFLYDNCATRPKDKIEECINGQIIYPPTPPNYSTTFRDIIHQYTQGHEWARFGIDLCIGREADHPITQKQMMFAPFYLMNFFKNAQIIENNQKKQLVLNTKEIIHQSSDNTEKGFIPTPLQCSLLLFAIVCGLTIYGLRKQKKLWGIDVLLFTLGGTVGAVLAFLALFSEHPAVSENYLLMVFHPGHLLALPYLIYCGLKKQKCVYHSVNLVVLTLFITLYPFIPQKFDLAVVPLALCLLIRSANHLILTYKKER